MSEKKYIKIENQESLEFAVERAADTLYNGGVILYPTDTLYGLGVDTANREAVEKLYNIKGRSNLKPVSLMFADLSTVKNMFSAFPLNLDKLFTLIFPGKVTALIANSLKSNLAIFEYLQYPVEKVGFRIPQNQFCGLLGKKMKNPISTTSANISGMADIIKISDLPDHFRDSVDLIIDSGDAEDTRGSTIIDFTVNPYKIVREGAVSEKALKNKFFDKLYSSA